MERPPGATLRRFGSFELDLAAGRLLRDGRTVRIQPRPFKLLCLLTDRPGALVTREDIQAALWPGDTFVDFEQGVNFAVKQVRDALGDRADASLYVQTVPRRGYRFLAPVDTGADPAVPSTFDAVLPELQKALWANIVELRLAEQRRRRQQPIFVAGLVLALGAVALLLLRSC